MKTLSNTITFSPETLPDSIIGLPYSQEIIMAGTTGGYNDVTIQGELPPGLSITRDFNKLTLSGTPTSVGNYPFTIVEIGPGGAGYKSY